MDIAVFGANGRVGAEIIRLCDTSDQHNISLAVVRDKSSFGNNIQYVNLSEVHNQRFSKVKTQVVIDFSHPASLQQAIKFCEKYNTPLLIGTTALSTENHREIAQLSAKTSVMLASNTSVAVHQITKKIVDICKFFTQQGDLKRVILEETHRLGKRDAPSGTALTISEQINMVTDTKVEIISHREPDAIASHSITLDLGSEMLHFSHQALSRRCFAEGAIKLAQWLIKQSSGQHSVTDYLRDIAD